MRQIIVFGEVAEWFKATVLKTVIGESLSRVRISPSPPIKNTDLVSVFLIDE